jgi:hypothetical protein
MPGILSAVSRLLTKDEKEHHLVVCNCIDIAKLVITKSLGDVACSRILHGLKEATCPEKQVTAPPARLDDKHKSVDIERNLEWHQTSVRNISMLLPLITSFQAHQHVKVRLELVNFCSELIREGESSLALLTPSLSECLVTLSSDNAEEVQRQAKESITNFCESSTAFITNILNSLSKILASLRRDIAKSNDGSKLHILQRLIGYISILGESAAVTVSIYTEQICDAFVWLLQPSFSNVKIVEDRILSEIKLSDVYKLGTRRHEFLNFHDERIYESFALFCKLLASNCILD